MQSSAGMPVVVKLQRDAAMYSICVCQSPVDNVAADYADICLHQSGDSALQHQALSIQHMPAYCTARMFGTDLAQGVTATSAMQWFPQSLADSCLWIHLIASRLIWHRLIGGAMTAGRPYKHRGSDQCSATCEEGVRLGLCVLLACLACLLERSQCKCCRSAGL